MQLITRRRVHTFGNDLYSVFRVSSSEIVGVDGGEGTPVPIPNTAVKLTCADNTWTAASREDKKMPTQEKRLSQQTKSFSFCMTLPSPTSVPASNAVREDVNKKVKTGCIATYFYVMLNASLSREVLQ